MKIRPTDLEAMRTAVTALDTTQNRQDYRDGRFPRADKVKNLDRRYQWDLLHASGLDIRAMYDYLTDVHIDSALRAIVPPLEMVQVHSTRRRPPRGEVE